MTNKLTTPLKIVLPYILFGVLYIVFSDRIVHFLFKSEEVLTEIQTYKGISFVGVTGLLLYFLSNKYANQIKEAFQLGSHNEQFYQSLIEHASDITLVSDSNGNVVFVGPNISNLLGYTAGEFRKYNLFQLIHPDDLKEIEAVNKQVLANPGILFTAEARVLHKNGHYEWIEGSVVNKINSPNIKGILTLARLISARKKAEENTKKSEIMFRAAFEQMSVGMANVDLNGKLVMMNERMCDITGYSREELQQADLSALCHPSQKAQCIKTIISVANGLKEACCAEKQIVCKDGTLLWVEQMLTLITDEDGAPEYLALVLKDIDARKKAEAQLAYRSKELDTFVYRSSHDLRGPITTMLGLTKVGLTDTHDETAREYLTYCKDVAVKMENTLDSLMAVTKIKQSKVTMAAMSPKCIVNRVLKRKKALGLTNSIELVLDAEDKPFVSSAELFEIILAQLIKNALVFKDRNKQAKVHVDISKLGNLIQLMITDNGIGIPEADTENIFDLYYKGKSPLCGNGIGLYLVKSAIDKLGGTINISSIPGKGTQVRVLLPEGDLSQNNTIPTTAIS